MLPAEFESAIPASKGPQNRDLNRAASGFGNCTVLPSVITSDSMLIFYPTVMSQKPYGILHADGGLFLHSAT